MTNAKRMLLISIVDMVVLFALWGLERNPPRWPPRPEAVIIGFVGFAWSVFLVANIIRDGEALNPTQRLNLNQVSESKSDSN